MKILINNFFQNYIFLLILLIHSISCNVEEEVKDDKKGKKKGPVVDPVEDEKNKLHIPENAISLAEWKEQNKRTAPVHKQVKVEVDLEPIKKADAEFLGVAGKKQTEKKKKTKEVDQKEIEINKLLANSTSAPQ